MFLGSEDLYKWLTEALGEYTALSTCFYLREIIAVAIVSKSG